MIRALVALSWGIAFGLGLGIAGVVKPQVILGFLDVTGVQGAWDPTLGIALTAAVLIYAPIFRRMSQRRAPTMAAEFCLPTAQRIDARLVLGAALFGAGWGIAGMCPGANVVGLGSGQPQVWLFALAWTTTLLVIKQLATRRARTPVMPRADLERTRFQ